MWVVKNINIFDNICKKLRFVLRDMFSGKSLPFGTIYSFISGLSSSQVSKLYFEMNLLLPCPGHTSLAIALLTTRISDLLTEVACVWGEQSDFSVCHFRNVVLRTFAHYFCSFSPCCFHQICLIF